MKVQSLVSRKRTQRKLGFLAASVSLLILSQGCRISARQEDTYPNTASSDSIQVGNPQSGQLQSLGVASQEFIPASPVSLAGFGGPGRRFLPPLFLANGETAFCRPYEKVIAPPRIKVAIFDVKKSDSKLTQLFLISLDIVAVTADMTAKIHQEIARTFPDTQPSLNNVVVLATHTHSGPSGLTENPLWSAFICDQYNNDLTESYLSTFKKTLKKAASSKENIVSIETLTADAPSLLKSRFSGMSPATDLSALSFRTDTGHISLSLARMAAHPTIYGSKDLTLTSDLVGPTEKAIAQALAADNVFLMQTEIGNMDAHIDGLQLDEWSQKISEVLKNGQQSSRSTLTISTQAGQLPLPKPVVNWKACGAEWASPLISLPILDEVPHQIPFALWTFDKEANLFLAGEWTSAAAAQLKSSLETGSGNSSRFKIFSLANDYTAYHLTRNDYSKKELESCSSLYGSGATEQISELILKNIFL